MRRLVVTVAIAVVGSLSLPGGVAAGGGGCHSTGGLTAGQGYKGITVPIEACTFTPTVLYIQPHDEVTWVNRDSVPHTVTGSGLTWGDGELLERDDVVTHSFAKEGVYPYVCNLHPEMVGAVVVGDPAVSRKEAGPIEVEIDRVEAPDEQPAAAAASEVVPGGATSDGLTPLETVPVVVLAMILGWALATGRRRSRDRG